MKKRNILIKAKKDDYDLEVVEECNGDIMWYMNGWPIMQQHGWKEEHECEQVKLLKGTEKEILVAGLGHGLTSGDALKIGNVTTVELLPEVIDFYKSRVPLHPNHTIIEQDIYNYLVNDAFTKFDAMLFQLDFLGSTEEFQFCKESNSRLYTPEFLQIIYDTLNSEGLFITEGCIEAGKPSKHTKLFEQAGFDVLEDRYKSWDDSNIESIIWRCTKRIP